MKQHKLMLALGAVLSVSFATALSAANPDPNRVMIKFSPGSKGAVTSALRGVGAQVHHELDIANAIAATVPAQALNGLRNNPNIELIEVDAPRYALGEAVPYGILNVQADQVVSVGADGTGVKVCVIDSGIKQDHEDFAGIAMTGTASAGQSWNTDSCGHGTHVAGTIAAVGGNGKGVIGVSPGKVSLHIVKVFDGEACGWSYASTLVSAAQACQSAGAKIINMSLGGSTSSSTENTAFNNLNNAGILSIAAAGNAGNNRHSYPASYSSVMSVAAVDNTNTVASFSQYTNQVEIAAPGVGVLSTYPISSGSVNVGTASYMASAMDGSPGGPSNAGPLVNGGKCLSAGAWAGATVLCERGDIAFSNKVLNVQSGGGRAAVLYNNVPGGFAGTLNGVATTIPSVSISQEDGQFLIGNSLGASATVDARTLSNANGYAYLDGTSMATPHVAGVAALLWSAKPSASNTEIRNAMNSTALDRGASGRDNYYGNGVVQAYSALVALVGSGGGGNVAPTASFTYSCVNLACSFNGSGSSDSDGTIAGYSWSFGGSGVTASHTFAAAGSYPVTLTVTDNGGATATSTQTVTVTSSSGGTISIATGLTFTKQGPNYTARGAAVITSDGSPVSGATVTGCFSGAVSGCATGTTASNGSVTILSAKFKTRAPVTFCVTSVNGTTFTGQCTSATP